MRLRIAALTDHEVRAASFGVVKTPLRHSPSSWADARGSIFDPAIFGPEHDWQCICRKYVGEQHENMVCHVCGARVAGSAAQLRLQRFGHIIFAVPISHPLAPEQQITALPVLPIGWRSASVESDDLNELYVQLLVANDEQATSAELLRINLERTVGALLMNERLREPVMDGDRILTSLASLALNPSVARLEALGAHLFAMGIKLVPEA